MSYKFGSCDNLTELKTRTIGRKLSRRLSLVAKVPNFLNAKLRQNSSVDLFSRSLDVTVIAPDKTQRILASSGDRKIADAIAPLIAEFSVAKPRLYLAGSLAEVNPEANVALLDDNILLIEDGEALCNQQNVIFTQCDWETRKFIDNENEYLKVLRSASELYDNSLTKISETYWDLKLIFDSICNIAARISLLINEVKSLLPIEDSTIPDLCCCFSDEFWNEYNDYLQCNRKSKKLLRQKSEQDDQFTTICKQKQGATKYSLEDIIDLPVQRLSDYERYFETLLTESRLENQRNIDEINKVKSKCKQVAKRGQRESDLERIQDLFPNDCLRLYDADALTMKVKNLMRKRNGAAARLQRALSTKSLRSESPPSQKTSISSSDQRTFLMEAPVQFSTGVQNQDRHLFLFNDLLLVAKPRSGGNFKLKEKVRISEIWLSKQGLDDISELNKSDDTSFVLGWPTTNVVVIFSTQAARDLWWNRLLEVFRNENEKEPCSTNIQVTYHDYNTDIQYCKTFSVGPEETAKDCVKLALEHLEMRHLEYSNFQLWAKTARDESPYPLVGHERPFAIKLSCLRDSLSSEDGFDLDHCNNVHDPVARCHFILRNNGNKNAGTEKKSNKKLSTRGMKIFRRSLSTKEHSPCLFGLPLSKLTDDESLPKPVMCMFYEVFAKGPFTEGIFRKCANVRLVRELREKLDAGETVRFEHIPVLVTAALLKDFVRSLPDPLLVRALYPQWRNAVDAPNLSTKLYLVKNLLNQLPKHNYLLLTYFLCVLYHVARRSCHTQMTASNLGVCVGPSLLSTEVPQESDDMRVVPLVVECLITHCETLCGSHVPSLLGDLRDSGTEESDSMKRDDSSIDSLECTPPPRKDKISLSRDSGLTMSDSQLYTPDEEESGSTSSSGYDPAFESPNNKVLSTTSTPSATAYVRVYPDWEDRLNPNFQRQAWFRQRSRRSAPKNDVRRTASEESLLDAPPPTPPRRSKPARDFTRRLVAPERREPINERYATQKKLLNGDYRAQDYAHACNHSAPGDFYNVVSVTNGGEDSSTLSDDDGTPQVSRSNSRGNEIRHSMSLESHGNNSCGNDSWTKETRSNDSRVNESRGNDSRLTESCGNDSWMNESRVNDTRCVVRGRVKRKEERAAHRSRSLPPPPPYRPPPPATSRRAPITSYYLGQARNFVVTKTYVDEESYV